MCGVNVGGLLCGTSIEFIESIKSLESVESVESSDSIGVYRVFTIYRAHRIYRIVRIYSFGTRGFQKNRFFHFWKYYFNDFFVFLGVIFRPRDPSKKLRHVVRINLVQFSAPELY